MALTVELVDSNSDGRIYFDEISLDSLDVKLEGAAFLNLPIELVGQQLDPLTIEVPDISNPTFNVTSVPDITGAISNIIENLSGIKGGWDALFFVLDEVLDGDLFGVEIPIIGDTLRDIGEFIQPIRDVVQNEFDVNSLAVGVGQTVVGVVQQGLFDALGPVTVQNPSAINILKDTTGDGNITIDDIPINEDPSGEFVEFMVSIGGDKTEIDSNLCRTWFCQVSACRWMVHSRTRWIGDSILALGCTRTTESTLNSILLRRTIWGSTSP